MIFCCARAKIPMGLHKINLVSGRISTIYQSAEWLSHPQFSPTDPALLMYSIEGPWHEVDRIWTIRSDGRDRKLVHKRTMQMEIAGHEFWSLDGGSIIFDWQYPKGVQFRLAVYDVSTANIRFAPLTAQQWSVHYSPSQGPHVFVGDGADARQIARSRNSQNIYLYRFDKAGTPDGLRILNAEALVDMRAHDYTLEPNARISPDGRWVLFRSNMFGYPEVFAVETTMTKDPRIPRLSTYQIATEAKSHYKHILLMDK